MAPGSSSGGAEGHARRLGRGRRPPHQATAVGTLRAVKSGWENGTHPHPLLPLQLPAGAQTRVQIQSQGPGQWGPEGLQGPQTRVGSSSGAASPGRGGGGVGGRAFPLRVHPRSCHPRLWTAGPCGRPSIWPCPVSSPPLVPATPDICSPFCSGDLRTGGECGGSDCRTLRPRMAVEGGEGRGYQKCKHRVLPSRAPRGNQGSALPAQASSPQASPSPSGSSAQLLGL